MVWSHVRDQRSENENVCDFAACQNDCNAGEETGRGELRMDERRWQHGEQGDRKEPACRRESVCASHPCHDAYCRDLRDDDEGGVEQNDDPDLGGANRCVCFDEWRQDVGETRVANDDKHEVGCDDQVTLGFEIHELAFRRPSLGLQGAAGSRPMVQRRLEHGGHTNDRSLRPRVRPEARDLQGDLWCTPTALFLGTRMS